MGILTGLEISAVRPIPNAPGVVVLSMQWEKGAQLQETPATSATEKVILQPSVSLKQLPLFPLNQVLLET